MKKFIFCASVIFTFFIIPAAFAGQVDLTTYYPAPYGEYQELRSTGNSYFSTSTGRVGIGTTIPSEKLDVQGGGKLRIGNTMIYDNEINRYNNDNLYIGYRTTANTCIQPNSGNVGIHNTSPVARLHVDGTGAPNGWGIYSFGWQGGVVGVSDGGNPNGVGVFGTNPGNGTGVWGSSGGGIGVYAFSNSHVSVFAQSNGYIGLYGRSTASHGVYGETQNLYHSGVYGYSPTTNGWDAGVFGVGTTNVRGTGVMGYGYWGVRGYGTNADFYCMGSGHIGSVSCMRLSPGSGWIHLNGHIQMGDAFNVIRLAPNANNLYIQNTSGSNRFAFDGPARTFYCASINNNPVDLAENIQPGQGAVLEPGDIVMPDTRSRNRIIKVEENYNDKVIGVISTKPGLLLNAVMDAKQKMGSPVSLAGRVPTKVSTINGPIKIGDPIAGSSIPGVGMKATESGRIIGYALENFPYTEPQGDEKVDGIDGTKYHEEYTVDQAGNRTNGKKGYSVGKISVFINPGWYDSGKEGSGSYQELSGLIEKQQQEIDFLKKEMQELKKK